MKRCREPQTRWNRRDSTECVEVTRQHVLSEFDSAPPCEYSTNVYMHLVPPQLIPIVQNRISSVHVLNILQSAVEITTSHSIRPQRFQLWIL